MIKIYMAGLIATITVKIIIIIVIIYDIITFPFYVIIQRPCSKTAAFTKKKTVQVEVGDPNYKTYITTRPHGPVSDMLIKKNIDTVDKVLQLVAEHYGNRKCLGTRKLLQEEVYPKPDGTSLVKKFLGPYQWRKYKDVKTEVDHFSRGLIEIGLEQKKPVAILGETRAEWLISALSCFQQNIPIATIYVTMHPEGIAHAINETEPTTLITTYNQLSRIKGLLNKLPTLNKIIYFQHQLHEPNIDFPDTVKIYSYQKICDLGKNAEVENNRPSPDDVAVIMFTSGTTGIPKGVIITHCNIMSTIRAFTDQVNIYPYDVMIGYLPLAHIFELTCEIVILMLGASIGYSSPLTMVDSSGHIKHGTKGDATILRPSIMLATPLVLDRINKKINRGISTAGIFSEKLIKFAISYKKFWYSKGFTTPIMNRTVFKGIRKILGGNIRLVICGSAPLSPATQCQLSVKLCVTMIQGYGLTETTCCGTSQNEGDLKGGRIGYPVTEAYIRLEEDEDTQTIKGLPAGELVLGGEFVSQGYYNQEENDDDYFEDANIRWFHTGDIAVLHDDGSFEIVDRKKDRIKLQNGEYISLGRIETELKTSQYVDNICLHANSRRYYPVAIVVPSPEFFEDFCDFSECKDIPQKDVCTFPFLESAMIDVLQKHAKSSSLNKFETPALVKLVPDVWDPESGIMTAGLKIKRKVVYEKYQAQIEAMYNIMGTVEEKDQI